MQDTEEIEVVGLSVESYIRIRRRNQKDLRVVRLKREDLDILKYIGFCLKKDCSPKHGDR